MFNLKKYEAVIDTRKNMHMSERYDLAIIGSGPAGLSSALNAKIRNKKFIIFGSKELSGKITKAEKINNIYAMGDYYSLMAKDKIYEASDVILATGVKFGRPFKGEEKFLGKGVGYCATCDAPLYKDKVEVDYKIEIINDIPLEIQGNKKAEKLILKNSEINTDGIFILRDIVI